MQSIPVVDIGCWDVFFEDCSNDDTQGYPNYITNLFVILIYVGVLTPFDVKSLM